VDRLEVRKPEFISAMGAVAQTSLLHVDLQPRPATPPLKPAPLQAADGDPTKV